MFLPLPDNLDLIVEQSHDVYADMRKNLTEYIKRIEETADLLWWMSNLGETTMAENCARLILGDGISNRHDSFDIVNVKDDNTLYSVIGIGDVIDPLVQTMDRRLFHIEIPLTLWGTFGCYTGLQLSILRVTGVGNGRIFIVEGAHNGDALCKIGRLL